MKQKVSKIIIYLILVFSCKLNAQIQVSPVQDSVTSESSEPRHPLIMGLGCGVNNFIGEVQNPSVNPVIGNYAWSLNFSYELDRRGYYKLNLFTRYGYVSGNNLSPNEETSTLNFRTDLISYGLSLEYDFRHIIKNKTFIRPFINAGIENIHFTPKADLYNSNQQAYYYWADGTIRLQAESSSSVQTSLITHRDYNYETDLRLLEKNQHGLGAWSQNTFSIPVDLGLIFRISDRSFLKLGTSLQYTFSDFIDNVSYKGTSVKGKRGNDIISYNYCSLHIDLIPRKASLPADELLPVEAEPDIMMEDEDGDYIPDFKDYCPGTPEGVAVDTSGCPLDQDNDGIPDYLDEERFSPPGAWVNEKGIAVSQDEYLKILLQRQDAMSREEVLQYFALIGKGFIPRAIEEMPEKFRQLDLDKDNYISFEELLLAIDFYFDGKLTLDVDDIYELNSFFFRQ